MFHLRNSTALALAIDSPIAPALKHLLQQRHNEFSDVEIADIASFLIIVPGDSVDAVEVALGFPIMTNLVDGMRYGHPDFEPSWEYIEQHSGGLFEIGYVLTDDFTHVLLIEDTVGMDAELLNLCRKYANQDQISAE